MKKKPSQRMKNHIRTYLTDEEHLALLRRMNQETMKSISAYVRRLIIMDSQNAN